MTMPTEARMIHYCGILIILLLNVLVTALLFSEASSGNHFWTVPSSILFNLVSYVALVLAVRPSKPK